MPQTMNTLPSDDIVHGHNQQSQQGGRNDKATMMTATAMAIETMRTKTMQQSNTAFRVAIIKTEEGGAISTNGEAIATLSIDKLIFTLIPLYAVPNSYVNVFAPAIS